MAGFEFWFHHGGLSVPELDASVRWYCEMLGFAVEREFEIPSVPARAAFLRNGPLRFELFEVADAVEASPERSNPYLDVRTHGNKHVAFAVADAHAVCDELRRRGVDVVHCKDTAAGTNAFIRDNSGNLIEFLSGPKEDLHAATL